MLQHIALQSRRVSLWTIVTAFALVTVVPAVMPALVSAAPAVTERELQSTSAIAGGTTNLTWRFDTTADAGNVDHIEIEFCDSPLSDCSAMVGNADSGTDRIPVLPGSPTATLGGPAGWNAPANSASVTAGDDGGTSNQILVDVTTPFAGASADEVTLTINGFTNDAQQNASYYTRIRIYSDTGSTLEWEGVFAQSTSQTLTVNARVQERLDFCVGSTTTNNATAAIPADCGAISGTNVDIGNVENGFTNVSPVATTNGGDNENGLAMVRTNAVNGVVIDYKAVQETSSGALKVAGASCSGTSTTDQCFNSIGTSAAQIVSGTENFGMVVAGINCNSVSAYTCNFGAGTYNLVRDIAYNGLSAAEDHSFVADADQETGTTAAEYAWDASGTADRIASSANSAVKVVDDEALILKFAATAGVTTPTGSYSVQTDYIATATF